MIVIEATTDSDYRTGRVLFEEYAAAIAVDLCFQSFNHELEHIREMYGPPTGCLLLAKQGNETVGCVAMRKLQPDVCEMKRMYVRPSARGQDAGRLLAVSIIDRARATGYRKMVLDTLSFMTAAQALYRSLGFNDTTAYYPNSIQGVIYMELAL